MSDIDCVVEPDWKNIPEPDTALFEQMLQDNKVSRAQSKFIERKRECDDNYEYDQDTYIDYMTDLDDYWVY